MLSSLFKITFVVTSLLVTPTTSCRCFQQPTVENSLADEANTEALRVRVKNQVYPPGSDPRGERYYAARVKAVFKGEERLPSQRILIKTATHSCGYSFQNDTVYLLFLSELEEEAIEGISTFGLRPCDQNIMWDALDAEEKGTLKGYRDNENMGGGI
uniref:NTR domain-containing protein n=1 Tax=Helicotheca tamesis TaxID=374047 RepID=A0A7S2HD89_9STRA